MTYSIRILREANRSLAKLPRSVQERIDAAVDDLSDNPRPAGAERLTSEDPIYRIRIGDYRALYTVDDDEHIVSILRIGHRRDVYRGI